MHDLINASKLILEGVQLPSLNREIAKLGKITLEKGNGYFYFRGADVIGETGTKGDTMAVYVTRLNDFSKEQWLSLAKDAIDKSRAR